MIDQIVVDEYEEIISHIKTFIKNNLGRPLPPSIIREHLEGTYNELTISHAIWHGIGNKQLDFTSDYLVKEHENTSG
jgi:hypothetical protein